MKKNNVTIQEIKDKLSALKGIPLKMEVNKGRKKIEHFKGNIVDLYPSVFTFKIENLSLNDVLSYSYSEVLCGFVKIGKITK